MYRIKSLAYVIVIFSIISCKQSQDKTKAEDEFNFMDVRMPHSLKYQESFDSLAKAILNQKEIFELDDFTREHKSVNSIPVFLGNKIDPWDSILCSSIPERCPKAFFKVVDSLKIDKNIVAGFQQKLKETTLRQFYKSNDSVLFIVDGFLSDSWGFFYSNKSILEIKDDFDFGTYSVSLLDTINTNWRKAAIH